MFVLMKCGARGLKKIRAEGHFRPTVVVVPRCARKKMEAKISIAFHFLASIFLPHSYVELHFVTLKK